MNKLDRELCDAIREIAENIVEGCSRRDILPEVIYVVEIKYSYGWHMHPHGVYFTEERAQRLIDNNKESYPHQQLRITPMNTYE